MAIINVKFLLYFILQIIISINHKKTRAMLPDRDDNLRRFQYKKPNTPEDTLAAIYEELNEVPSGRKTFRSELTVKGYLSEIYEQIRTYRYELKRRNESQLFSESFSLGMCGLLGLILVFVSAQSDNSFEWWTLNSYTFFAIGIVATVIFVAASIEKSSLISQMLKFNSVKLLCAFLFSAAVIYSAAQANTILNGIFSIDGSNFPYSRAILSAAYFLKICTPFIFTLTVFALVHVIVVWSAKSSFDFHSFPWNSVLFILAALVVAGIYWNLTHNAFGDNQIKQKAYKLAHYLDFNTNAHCFANVGLPEKKKSFIFFGNDQNKILIDDRLEVQESLGEFLKGRSLVGHVNIPEQFRFEECVVTGKKN